jgi:hypothetical protein
MAVTRERLLMDPRGAPGDLVPLAPSDAADQLPDGRYFRGLRVTADGTVSLVTLAGVTRTFPAGFFAAGVAHEVAFSRLLATGTTATVWGLV